MRRNHQGALYVPHGYVAALQCDPIEKKPFYHVRPGALALSFGMLGCDYHCAYCQNWLTSQALRDPVAGLLPRPCTAKQIVDLAIEHGAEVITSTYNEPLITSEWAVEVFRLAKARGLMTAYVSNGNATPEVLEYLHPWLDLYKVDLKGFDDRRYRKLGGVLATVQETIRHLVRLQVWVEVVTLVVPGFNDDQRELEALAGFLAEVSPDIPWHVTAFHPDYRLDDAAPTTAGTLLRAVEIGRHAGLRYVYAGNLPGQVGGAEHTYCPSCGRAAVKRYGYRVDTQHLRNGACARCGAPIAGRWGGDRTETLGAWIPRAVSL